MCLILCDPIDSNPAGSSVPGILQAGTLDWVAVSVSIARTKPRPPHSQADTISVIQAIKDKVSFIIYVVKQMQNKDGCYSRVMSVFLIQYYWICFLSFVLVKLVPACWRRKWQPTPVFLPGKSHGQKSLAGYSPWGCGVARG